MLRPPSTVTSEPVAKPFSSEANHSALYAMSSGMPRPGCEVTTADTDARVGSVGNDASDDDGVDLDVVWRSFDGQHVSEGVHATLGHGVGSEAADTDDRVPRRYVDDVAAPGFLEVGHSVLPRPKHVAGQGATNDVFPLRGGVLGERFNSGADHVGGCCVVDERVELAEALDHRRRSHFGRCLLG